MTNCLVVTVTCPDHPGIVERLTDVVAEHSANWEESRMARLGGDFAGIVKIRVSPENTEALATALQTLADEELSIAVKVTQPAAGTVIQGATLCDLSLSGADHEGIVHAVAAYLAERGVNVEAMDTEVVAAPISGSPLFQMQAQIQVPPELELAELQANLEDLGQQLGFDIEVSPHQA